MAKVTGLGGAFFAGSGSEDPLCLVRGAAGGQQSLRERSFPKQAQRAYIAVAFFPKSSNYFPPSQPAMLNFQVDDLDGVFREVESGGSYGRS